MDDGFEIVLEKITNTFIRIELLSTLKTLLQTRITNHF